MKQSRILWVASILSGIITGILVAVLHSVYVLVALYWVTVGFGWFAIQRAKKEKSLKVCKTCGDEALSRSGE